MKNEKLFLILVFIVAFALRIVSTNSHPPLLWDEAALGYNSYSILKTGHDEYGKFMPFILKSFGDFKPGLYIYLCLPFIKFLGLTPLAVRLPSILLGSFLPILIFLLIKKLTKNNSLCIIATILAIFTPAFFHYSRGAWETNIFLFELIAGSYLFFSNRFFWSSILFASTLYTYQSAKLITPLFLISLLIVSHPKPLPFLKKKKELSKHLSKIFLNFILPLGLLALPIAYRLLTTSDTNRLKVVGLFSFVRPQSEIQMITKESSTLDYDLFHNRIIFFSRNFLARYFNHFSPEYLTFIGDYQNTRHNAPYVGILLIPSILFLIIGLFNYKKEYLFFYLILFLSPIASAITRDQVQTTRSLPFVVPLIFFTASGISIFLKKYSNLLIHSLLIAIYLLSFIYYADLYFNHMIKVSPHDWLGGYQQSMQYFIDNQPKYKNKIFTQFYGQPYIYYLFLSQYPPFQYQKQAKLEMNSIDVGKVTSIDEIIFDSPGFSSIKELDSVMAVLSYDEVVRQNLDFKMFKKFGNFYIYEKL